MKLVTNDNIGGAIFKPYKDYKKYFFPHIATTSE